MMLNEIDKMVARFGAMIAAYEQNVNMLAEANQRLTEENRVLKMAKEELMAQLLDADAKFVALENAPAKAVYPRDAIDA